MKEKELIQYVAYSPNKSLKIEGAKVKSKKWRIVLIFIISIFLSFITNKTGDILPFLFIGFFIAFTFNNSLKFISNYIEFSTQKVIVRENREHKELEQSFYLKSPMYLDITIKPRKELLLITFEQFGETIGTTALPPDEVPYMLDSLSDLLGLEIHETRSTNKQEDVLYLRPIGSDENLLPSYLKITENPMRLIVNPVATSKNFIVNYQRKIIKTATGNIYPLHDIQTINLTFVADEISITGLDVSYNNNFEIITFSANGYHSETIKKDLQLLADFLKSKPNLNHVIFQIT